MLETGSVRRCDLSDTLTRHIRQKPGVMAHHQAGHAVMAYILDYPYVSLSVDGACGEMRYQDRISLEPDEDRASLRTRIHREICLKMAGAVAETIYTRYWQDCSIDEYSAKDLVTLLYPRTQYQRWETFVNRCRFVALETLMRADVWRAVEAVAAALTERSSLTSRRANHIIRTTLPEGFCLRV